VREHGTEKIIGVAPLALGVSLAARGKPEEALPPIERGVALSRTFGQPIQLANALLSQAPVLRALGEHERAADAVAEARSILGSCPDPGILAGRLAALGRPPQIRPVRSGDQDLTQQELRVLKLLHGDLSQRDIGRELYVSHST
jgi:LuxR family transcriptional regulator, maltose regulon positive regulatory protein